MKRRLLPNVPSFMCGVGATILALSLFTSLRAQPSDGILDACAGADGALRLLEPGGGCSPGERRMRLRGPSAAGTAKNAPADERHLLDLGRRVKDLEERAMGGRLMASRVYAPFEVINEEGYAVFKVDDHLVTFSNTTGTPVARIAMTSTGGFFEAKSTAADIQAVLGTSGKQGNLFVFENGVQRISLGSNEAGQYGLRVYETGGKLVAGIGQSRDGDGVVSVSDQQGHLRAAMYVENGGALHLWNTGGKTVASLTSAAGSGLLQLSNRDGVTMVEAGVDGNAVGQVSAGPAGFHPGAAFVGAPGSYIRGKAAR